MSSNINLMLQKVFIAATGRSANATEIDSLKSMESGGSWQPLIELIDTYMTQRMQANGGGEQGIYKTIQEVAANAFGIDLSLDEAKSVTQSLINDVGIKSWSGLFTWILELQNDIATVLGNRAEAGQHLNDKLTADSKTIDVSSASLVEAVKTYIQSVTGSSASLNTTKAALEQFVTNLTEAGLKTYVIDGYLKGAEVFVDANGDGKWNTDEFKATTADDGSFILPKDAKAGKIIAQGGTDLLTGKPFQGVLKAPVGAVSVTPLTTLVQAVAEQEGVSLAQAKEQVTQSLGVNVNPMAADPLAQLAKNKDDAQATKLLQVQQQVAAIITQSTQSIAAAASDKDVLSVATQVVQELAKVVTQSQGAPVDLTKADTIASVVQSAAQEVGATQVAEKAKDVANVVAASTEAIAKADDLTTLVKAATAAQTTLVDQLKDAVSKGTIEQVAQNAATVVNQAVQQTAVTGNLTPETSVTDVAPEAGTTGGSGSGAGSSNEGGSTGSQADTTAPVTFLPNANTTSDASDASTAIALDNRFMLVGDDEANVLRVYPRQGGATVKEWSYASNLGLDSGELDLEASARIGDTLYFIGSHSNKSGGNDDNNREHLFAVTVTGTGENTEFTFVGKYSALESALASWDSNNAHNKGANYFGFTASSNGGVAPEQANGFSIEGLVSSPDNSALWLAFRAPMANATSRDKAVIVPLTNFNALLSTNPPTPQFGTPIELDLGGRGIRSIEKATDGSGYLIIAGPSGAASEEVTHDFRLYTWDGVADHAPVELSNDLDSLLASTKGSFETIVELKSIASNTWVQLLQDNGDTIWPGKSQASKSLPPAEQQFQGNWIQLATAHTDNVGPVLKASTPADNATDVGKSSNIVLKFDEAVKAGTGSFLIKKSSDNSTVETISANDANKVSIAFNTVTLNPTNDLLANTEYYIVTEGTALTDHKGNAWAGLTGSSALNFTTAAPVTYTLLITEANSNANNGDFFELYNYGTHSINLSGWKWDDDSANLNADDARAFGDVTLAPGGKLVVISDKTANDIATFKTAWNITDPNIQVIAPATAGPGLGKADAVVVFDNTGQVAAAFNYKTSSITASDGTVILPATRSDGNVITDSAHAGQAVGGSDEKASAVWDGKSLTNPNYTHAVADKRGAYSQSTSTNGTGSPGKVEPTTPHSLDLAAEDDTGVSNSDRVTKNTNNLTITGTADPGITVTIYNGTTVLGSGTVANDGTFSIDVNLNEGIHSLTAKATDAASNKSVASSALVITVDQSQPQMVSAQVSGNGMTITYSEALAGTAENGDYTVTANGSSVTVSNAAIGTGDDANKVTLTLGSTIGADQVVTVAYTNQGTQDSIKDAADNAAQNQTLAQGTTNNDTINLSNLSGAIFVTGLGGADTITLSNSAVELVVFTASSDGGSSGDIINSFDDNNDELFFKQENFGGTGINLAGSGTRSEEVDASGSNKADLVNLGENFNGMICIVDNASSNFDNVVTIANGVISGSNNGIKVILLIDNGTDTQIYFWNDGGGGGNANSTVESSELTLIGTLQGLNNAAEVEAGLF